MCGACGSRPLIEPAASNSIPATFASTAGTHSIPATFASTAGTHSIPLQPKNSLLWLKIGLPVILGTVAVIGLVIFLASSNKVVLHVTTVQYRTTCGELTSSDATFSGATVIVRNASRTMLGSGALTGGKTGHDYNKTNHWVSTCTFKSDVSVPKNEATYLIRVGSVSGGAIAFNHRDLVNDNWNATITVGYSYDPPTYTYGSSYSDGYNWGYQNAYSTSDCDWWSNGPSYDDSSLWESGCRAGYYANPY